MPVFTPEEKKIFDQEVESVKQGMLANKRTLVSKYGKDAEKIIQGRAVKQALEKIENLRQNQEMENNKLKEMVKKALTKPLKEQDVEVRADKEKETQASLIMNALIDSLESHDWYYAYSDDHRAYDRGRIQEREINKLMKDLELLGFGDDAKRIYNEYAPENMSIKEDFDLGHEDDEPHDLKSQLYCIGKSAMELYQMVDKFEGEGEVDFPAWWQNKINTAKNMIGSAKSYLEFELKEPMIDAEMGVMNEEINRANLQQELVQAFASLKPVVSVYGNNGEVKFEIKQDANESAFNSVINYLEGHNFVVDREQSKPYYDREDGRESFPRIRFTIKGPNTETSLPYLDEKHLTAAELKKREEIVKAMKKDFKGSKGAMYAIATEKAKKVAETIAKELKEARFEKGEDVGKPGKGFAKIAKAASKEYGSEEAGKRVAGAILKKVLKAKTKDEELKEARFEKGEDVGEPGKGFSKIAKSAAERYGSEEAGKRVAGAILKRVLKNK